MSLDSTSGDCNTEPLLIFNKPPCDGDFPLLRLLVVAFGETQLFAVNTSGRLDSCKDRDYHYFYERFSTNDAKYITISGTKASKFIYTKDYIE